MTGKQGFKTLHRNNGDELVERQVEIEILQVIVPRPAKADH
jgi:hypothetical protein